jgi:hypothetical protein
MPPRLLDRGHGRLPGLKQEDRQDEVEHLDTTPPGCNSVASNGAQSASLLAHSIFDWKVMKGPAMSLPGP